MTITGDIDATEPEASQTVLALRLAVAKLGVHNPKSLTVEADLIEYMERPLELFREYGKLPEHPDR